MESSAQSKIVTRRELLTRMGPLEALRRITTAMRAKNPEEAGLYAGMAARRARSNAIRGSFRLDEGIADRD